MTGHTPGPWIAHEVGNIWLILSLDEKARAAGLPSIAVDNKVDAHIIAAAPEVLEALKLLVGLTGPNDDGLGMKFSDRLAKARTAIAKAEGLS